MCQAQNIGIFEWTRARRTDTSSFYNHIDPFKGSHYLAQRLSNSAKLTGHNGCVNTVSWSADGSHLLSGSDDCHLNIYDALKRKLLLSFHSSHRSNIFSAKFLPSPCDFKCVSCAGLGSVEFSEFTPSGDYLPHLFNCQNSITYQVITTPCDPNEFLTCEERGYVRLFDLRVKSSCSCDGCDKDVLYAFPCGVTSVSVHPLSPNYLSLALGDGTVCLMDRRVTGYNGMAAVSLTPATLASKACVTRFKPESQSSKPFKITSVQFNETGSELLVNYSEDYLYLFSSCLIGCGGSADSANPPTTSRYNTGYSEKRRKENSSSSSSQPPSNFTPPTKRLRLRGDWSDTGPDARPDNNEGRGGEEDEGGGETRSGRATFMNRMSHLFARWIDESLNSNNNNTPSTGGTVNATRDGEMSPVHSDDSSFRLFSDEDSNDDGDDDDESASFSSGPRTPTASLTTAMASCTTDSPHKLLRDGNSDTGTRGGGGDGKEAREIGGERGGGGGGDGKEAREIGGERGGGGEDGVMAGEGVKRKETTDGHLRDDRGGERGHSYRRQSQLTRSTSDSSRHTLIPGGVGEEKNTAEPDEGGGETERSDISRHDAPTLDAIESNRVISIQLVEGESDSDDLVEEKDEREDYYSSDDEREEEIQQTYSSKSNNQPLMMYQGHRNARTMIKQATFWGNDFIMSGSDCGRIFVWNKWTGEIVNALVGDSHVVNCVQPHPCSCLLATSGIDYDIKLWEPISDTPCDLTDLDSIILRNETMLQESRNTITVPSSFILHVLAYLNRRRRMRGEDNNPTDEESN